MMFLYFLFVLFDIKAIQCALFYTNTDCENTVSFNSKGIFHFDKQELLKLAEARLENKKHYQNIVFDNFTSKNTVVSIQKLSEIYLNSISSLELEIDFFVMDDFVKNDTKKLFCFRIEEFISPVYDKEKFRFHAKKKKDIQFLSKTIEEYYEKNACKFIRLYLNLDTEKRGKKEIVNQCIFDYNYWGFFEFLGLKNALPENISSFNILKETKIRLFKLFIGNFILKENCNLYHSETTGIIKSLVTKFTKDIDYKQTDCYFVFDLGKKKFNFSINLKETTCNKIYEYIKSYFIEQKESEKDKFIVFNSFCTIIISNNDYKIIFDDVRYYDRVLLLTQKYVSDLDFLFLDEYIEINDFVAEVFKKIVNIIFPKLWDKLDSFNKIKLY